MLTITDQAVEAIRMLLGREQGGVRISVASSPLNGHGPGLIVEPVLEPQVDDTVIETGEFALYVDESALEVLEDQVLDADADGDSVRFSVRPE
jgi:Fe-S cluster assembly iron-binding protein IscA